MSIFEDVFGRGYDRERAYECRYQSEREDDYMVCGQCGQSPHEGPCDSPEVSAIKDRLQAINANHYLCNQN